MPKNNKIEYIYFKILAYNHKKTKYYGKFYFKKTRRWSIKYTNLHEYPDIDYLIQSIHEFQAHIVSNNQHYSNKIVVDCVVTKMRLLIERVSNY